MYRIPRLFILVLVACGSPAGSDQPDASGDDQPACTTTTGEWGTVLEGSLSATPAVATTPDSSATYVVGYLDGGWLVKLDGSGAIAWQRLYTGVDRTYSIAAAVTTPDLGTIIAGSTTPTQTGPTDAWIAKIDPDGTTVWQRRLDIGGVVALAPTDDGGYLAVGEKAGVTAVKLDAAGAVQWAKSYDIYPESIMPYDVKPTTDGGSVVIGRYAPYVTDHPAWVIKLDSTGAIQWQKSYGGGGGKIVPLADGSYVMGGAQYANDGSWVVKLDATGAVEWQNSFFVDVATGDPPVEYRVSSVRPNGDGYAVAGMVGGYPGPLDSSGFYAQLDASGTLLDHQYYGGSDISATMYAMDSAGCDHYVITGFLVGRGAWVAKVDAHGDLPGCSIVRQATLPVVVKDTVPIDAEFTAHAASVVASDDDAVASTATAVASPACQ